MLIEVTKINPRDEKGQENPPDHWGVYVGEKATKINKFLVDFAGEVADTMRNIITSNKKRQGGTNLLENTIDVEIIPDGVGVGNIDKLNTVVPYWAMLNWGGMVALKAQKVPGFFSMTGGPFMGNPPDSSKAGTGPSGGGKEYFYYTPRGINFPHYMMIVKNPITGINFVEKTQDWVKNQFAVKFGGVVNL